LYLKDYYSILELPSSASMDEIKKAYRRLAHQYHPDKNANDLYAAAQFAEIKEAYETLTNPTRKDHYLQQRWYARSMGKRSSQMVVNPVTVLKQLLELDQYTHTLDEHRMDKEGLYHYLCDILSNENIEKINLFQEESVNKEIIRSALKSARLLPYKLAVELAERLRKINVNDESAGASITGYLQQKKQIEFWEKKRVWGVVVIVIILAVVIFFTAK
jgi:molecular chaperone DnaJ